MAISRDGTLVSSISGKLGSVVFYQGARAGVIAPRGPGSKSVSEDQQKRRLQMLNNQALWRTNYDNHCPEWNVFASKFPWSNRIGVRRPISGYNAWLAYAMRLWPYPPGIRYLAPPPLAITTQSPVITSLSFAHGGPYNVTVANVPSDYPFEFCNLQTGLQYGPRVCSGASKFFNAPIRHTTTSNYYTVATDAGIILKAGDVIRVSIYWVQTYKWPSLAITLTTTVI